MPTLLFDIDGTLVRTGGAGKLAMEAALRAEFAVAAVRDTVKYSGRTDRAIAADLLAAHDRDPSRANQVRLQEAYLARLPAALAAAAGTVCPGVRELLALLHPRADVRLGLLTGNVRAGARLKLEYFDLWHLFPAGGFGDDSADRDDVARAALRAMRAHTGTPPDPADVWVIGDTPFDVTCARAIGAKAVAVATGWHPIEELHATGADFVLADLTDPRELLERWRGGKK